MLDAYFGKLPPRLLQYVKDGSERVDFYYQTPESSYMHAMRAPDQSIADAKRKTCEFIRVNMQVFRALQNSSIAKNRRSAYLALGAALHAVMDSTSPSHRGFQIWNPAGSPKDSFNNHGNNSPEDLDHLTDALLAESIREIDAAMRGDPSACAQ